MLIIVAIQSCHGSLCYLMTAVEAGGNNQSVQKNGKTDLKRVVPVKANLLTESLSERLHNRIKRNLDFFMFIIAIYNLRDKGTIYFLRTIYRYFRLRDLFVISFHLVAFNLFGNVCFKLL